MRGEAMVARIAAICLLVTATPALAQQFPDAAVVTKGQVTYLRYCVACHGKTARGDGPLATELQVGMPDLTTLAARNGGKYPYDRVVMVVEKGDILRGHVVQDMPAWGDAFKKTAGTEEPTVGAAIRNLANYLWSVQR